MANKSFLIKVNQEDKIMLERIKKATNIPFSKILRYLLNLYFQDENISDSIVIQKYKFYSNEKHTISIKLTREEYENLKTLCKENGFSSITKQAKFLLLNSIKNEKLFTNIEIDEFIKTRTEINAIGKNIYQLLKILRSGNSVKINENNLNKTMDNIRDKIDILSDQLGAIIEKNNERI